MKINILVTFSLLLVFACAVDPPILPPKPVAASTISVSSSGTINLNPKAQCDKIYTLDDIIDAKLKGTIGSIKEQCIDVNKIIDQAKARLEQKQRGSQLRRSSLKMASELSNRRDDPRFELLRQNVPENRAEALGSVGIADISGKSSKDIDWDSLKQKLNKKVQNDIQARRTSNENIVQRAIRSDTDIDIVDTPPIQAQPECIIVVLIIACIFLCPWPAY